MKNIRTEKVIDTWNICEDDTGRYSARFVCEQPSIYGIDNGRITRLLITNTVLNRTVLGYEWGSYIDALERNNATLDLWNFYDEIIKTYN